MTAPSSAKRKAILLVAKGVATNAEIAEECGVSPRTVLYWRRDRDFQQAVEAELKPWLDKLRDREVHDRNNRLDRLNSDRLRLLAIRDARAEDPRVQDVPGGKTGLVILHPTAYGLVARVDYRMLERLDSMEEQAARELGQRVDKHLHIRSFRDLTDEELAALVAEGISEFGEDAVRT